MTVYFLTSDTNAPFGGVRQSYAAVDALRTAGYDAAVVHRSRGFRVSWFEHDTAAVWAGNVTLKPDRDLVVVPEFRAGKVLERVAPGVLKIIFNQAPYLTFRDFELTSAGVDDRIFRDRLIAGIVTVSSDAERLLKRCFRSMEIHRVRLGVKTSAHPRPSSPEGRTRTLVLVQRKRPAEARLLAALLRDPLARGWRLRIVENMTAKEVRHVLGESAMLIHLPATPGEGLSLVLLEAMSEGCLVIGYSGHGGDEVMGDGRAITIAEGDIVGLADAVSAACDAFDTNQWSSYADIAYAGRRLVDAAYRHEDYVESWSTALERLSASAVWPSKEPYSRLDERALGELSVASGVRARIGAAADQARKQLSALRQQRRG